MTPQSLFDIGTIIHKKGFETTTNRPHVGMGECLVLPQDLQTARPSLVLRTSDPKAELATYTNKVQEACIK